MSQRKAEKLTSGEWKSIDNKDIKKGDIVRMIESGGILDPLTAKGVLADSDAFEQDDGTWAFHGDFNSRGEE